MKTLLIAICLLPTMALANFKFSSELADSKVQAFLQDVDTSLPPLVKRSIGKDVIVRFSKLRTKEREVLGMTVKVPLMTHKTKTIILDESLLESIREGKDLRKAKATLLHETSHIFDLQNKILKFEQEIGLGFKSYTVSDSPIFLNLTGWKKKKQQNKKLTRRVDVYEDKSPQETFAVNFEYFLTDPEFQCRKPGLYHYLSESLDHVPFKEQKCETEYSLSPEVDPNGELVKPKVLDPKKLYEVHYLFAGKGKQMMSRWGHAMIRLVMCAPSRNVVDEKCLQDRSYHLVLSFRADITNFKIDSIKGLTGKYPSKMFVLSLGEVINEYTVGELRDLYSIPLKMTSEQKIQFVNLTLEKYWGYQGKYYFVTNNCAHETLNLLKPVYPDDIKLVSLKVSTPLGVRDELVKAGIADMDTFADLEDAKKKGYYFESYHPKLQRAFDDLISSGVLTENERKYEAFMNSSTVELRQELIERVKESKDFGKLLLIEKAITSRLILGVGQKVSKKLDELNSKEQGDPIIEDYKEIEKLQKKKAGLDVSKGYGIPQKSDQIFVRTVFTPLEDQSLQERKKRFMDELKKLFKPEYDGIQASLVQQHRLLKKISEIKR